MLTSLLLRNFQKHKKLLVKLDPHITCFIGSSDAGKSSILRALRWVCRNKPTGDAFIRSGAKFASVQVKVDGRTVKRKKGKQNLYIVDGSTLKAFGQDVPKEVAELLSVTDVNFQNQHDPPFWFALSPGQVSKELNQIIGLEEIDTALSKINSQVRSSKAILEVSQSRLQETQEKHASLQYVPGMADSFAELQAKYAHFERSMVSVKRLRVLLSQVKQSKETKGLAGDAALQSRFLVDQAKKVLDTKNRVEKLTSILERLSSTKTKQRPPDISHLDKLLSQTEGQRNKLDRLEKLVGELRGYQEQLCRTRKKLLALEKNLERKLKGICPLCGGKIPKS